MEKNLKKALVSVSDKTDLTKLVEVLIRNNFEIIATGSTAKHLKENGYACVEISSYTAFPEIFDGRVKTLHPKVFGGILMRRDNFNDLKIAEENNIFPIDLVCVNLYPFEKYSSNPEVSLEIKIENIDIGGPSLIRAAAKNYKYVCVLTNPSQYEEFIDRLEKNQLDERYRAKLAYEAFSHTNSYDATISTFFENEFNLEKAAFRISLPITKKLRYGENPHQEAYIAGNLFEYFEIYSAKEISYNNVLDLICSASLVEDLGYKSCAIIKHNNPCGAAIGESEFEAYTKALSCDPVSAFGGIVAINGKIDEKLAEKLNDIFLEVVLACDYEGKAIEILSHKKNRRIVKQIKSINKNFKEEYRSIPGGVLIQQRDLSKMLEENIKVVTKKNFTKEQIKDALFAAVVAKSVKSNAIVFAKNGQTIGIGAGQMSRIDSTKIAIMKAKENGFDLKGSVVASDAFFPFADNVYEIAKAGAVAIIQPGGSVRDEDSIKACDELNIAMAFTGIRNFKH